MSELVQAMTEDILKAYKSRDSELAKTVRDQDEKVDMAHNSLFRELLTYMMEDTSNISACMHVLFIAKNIERMGDNIADIAQEIVYMATGEWPDSKRIKGDKTSKIILS
jgi:phosphate transport system protein